MAVETWEYVKDPSDVVDFSFTWRKRLKGDTIQSSSWAVASGDTSDINIDTSEFTDTVATVWVSEGTANTKAHLTNTIVTAEGRTMEQTGIIVIKDN